jgi:transcriptional regulator with XRE-family HTH domain
MRVFPNLLILREYTHMNWTLVRSNIKHLMEAQGLNDTTLAALCGVPQPTIWRFLTGATNSMLLDNLKAIADSLDSTVGELIGETPLELNEDNRRVLKLMQRIPKYRVRGFIRTAEAFAESDDELPKKTLG